MSDFWTYTKRVAVMAVEVWERSQVAAILLSLFGSVVLGLAATVGLADFEPDERNVMVATFVAWSIAFHVLVFTPFRLWRVEHGKVRAFEAAAEPKLEVSEPIQIAEPKGVEGRARVREWRLQVTNISSSLVQGCYVKKIGFTNKLGQPDDSVGQRFRLNTDPHNGPYTNVFDLPPGGHELIAVASVNEQANEESVWMKYASNTARNLIPQRLFPHRLRIQVCAENISAPIEREYVIDVQDGILTLTRQ